MYSREVNQYLKEHGYDGFRLKAVLFDMDGVLYDSMPNHAIAWERSMAKFGIKMTAQDAYATEGARGVDTIRMMVKQQQGRDITEEEAQRMYDEKTRCFHEMPEAPIMPGIKELMAQIKARALAIGVVTGSGQRPLINRLLKDFPNIKEEYITTAYDVKKGKPAPDPYLKALLKMRALHPREALVVENAPLGVRASVAANLFTIAVNTGPLSAEALINEKANLLFARMWDLNEAWPRLMKAIEPQITLF